MELQTKTTLPYDIHYLGFVECFNQQLYYEAHDVLEELWLGTRGDQRDYYKGLIQIAGAFVHLKKGHTDPAARLMRLSTKYLTPFVPVKDGLRVASLLAHMQVWLRAIEESHGTTNPYNPQHSPQIIIE